MPKTELPGKRITRPIGRPDRVHSLVRITEYLRQLFFNNESGAGRLMNDDSLPQLQSRVL